MDRQSGGFQRLENGRYADGGGQQRKNHFARPAHQQRREQNDQGDRQRGEAFNRSNGFSGEQLIDFPP